MKEIKKSSLESRVEKLAVRIESLAGKTGLVFLDNCAIIDFEREIERHKLVDSSIHGADFYKAFVDRGIHFYVTEHILGEALNHNSYNLVKGKPEISSETIGEVVKMHQKYCDFIKIGEPQIPIDKVRYDTYWASLVAFDEYHKKSCIDPISKNDRELVSSTVWAKHLEFPGYLEENVKSMASGAVIISPDCHVVNAVNVLTGRDCEAIERIKKKIDSPNSLEGGFGYNGIYVISSR